MGKTGITYNDLNYLSVEDILKIAEGKEDEMRTYWMQSKMISYWAFKGHAKKGFKPNDVISFPWEKKEEIRKEKISEIRANANKLRELINGGKVKFKA